MSEESIVQIITRQESSLKWKRKIRHLEQLITEYFTDSDLEETAAISRNRQLNMKGE